MDMVMARLMGFDYGKIPILSHHAAFADPDWGNFAPEELTIEKDGNSSIGLKSLVPVQRFLPPPGWSSHIELEC